jgi:hypothetical protein
MEHTVRIPGWHPTRLNKLLNSHWATAGKMKKCDRGIIKYYCREIPKAKGKRLVRFTIVLKKKQRAADPDAYFKSLLDGLVHAGMLKDDNRQWCEIEQPKYARSGSEIVSATIITLIDIKEIKPMLADGALRDHRVKPTGKTPSLPMGDI